MAGFPAAMPPMTGAPPGMGALPPGAPPPTPPPAASLAAAKPGGGGGMGMNILLFLAGVGFQHFSKALQGLRGDKGKDNKTPAGSLLNSVSGGRGLPGAAISPGGPATPPLLAGGMNPNMMAMLAKISALAGGS